MPGACYRVRTHALVIPLARLLCTLIALSACATAPEPPGAVPTVTDDRNLIAVFPVDNLSGKAAPTEEMRVHLIGRLRAQGLRILDDAALDALMTKHRVRYTAGLEQAFARALAEAGVTAVLIPSLETYDETRPPRIALFARLVSTGELPAVVWLDSAGYAGDESPGILGIGLVDDARVLVTRAVDAIAGSLALHVRVVEAADAAPRVGRKFRPKIVYRSEALDPTRTYSVAVVPFFNRSTRRYAGEIMALHLMKSLLARNLRVVEPALVREQLLRFRIIMTDGVSLADTDTILNAADADLVLNGEVLEYYELPGGQVPARIDFSVLFIERRSRRVLYSSYSHNAGDDRVVFFDWGRVYTAHTMAAYMAHAISDRMLFASATPRSEQQERK
jgi:hypothetical protein